jgi:hypothetical protein
MIVSEQDLGKLKDSFDPFPNPSAITALFEIIVTQAKSTKMRHIFPAALLLTSSALANPQNNINSIISAITSAEGIAATNPQNVATALESYASSLASEAGITTGAAASSLSAEAASITSNAQSIASSVASEAQSIFATVSTTLTISNSQTTTTITKSGTSTSTAGAVHTAAAGVGLAGIAGVIGVVAAL